MTLTRIVGFVIAAGLLALGIARTRDPHRTKLPFGTADLSSVQAQLDALPDSERVLVLGYVRRSRGDVLPPRFADPEAPLTARTFGEAIALQRRFLAAQAVVDAQVAARRRERAAALAPLRAVLQVEVAGRAIMSRGRAWQPAGWDTTAYGRAATQAIDDTPVLVTTYRVRNVGSLTVQSLQGQVEVRAADRGRGGLDRLSTCFLDHRESLAPGQSTEIRCAKTDVRASAKDSAYVAMPERDLVLDWMPRAIVFENGTSLAYTGD
jgi:hypothetical protein